MQVFGNLMHGLEILFNFNLMDCIDLKYCTLDFHFSLKELSSDVFEDEYLDDYVKAIFRFGKSHMDM